MGDRSAHRILRQASLLLCAALVCADAHGAALTSLTWNDNSADNLLTTTGNFVQDLGPNAGAQITFDGTLTSDPSVLLPSALTINSATFTGPTAFSISDATGSFVLTIETAVTNNTSGTGAINFNLPVSLGGNVTVTNTASSPGASLVFQGNITGNGNTLTVDNTGASLVQINGTYTGGSTVISSGSLTVGNGSTGGAMISGNVSNSGALVFVPASTDNLTYSGVISGTGGVSFAGTGIITFSGNNTYSGPTSISGGTLSDAAPAAFSPNSQMQIGPSGALDVTENESIVSLAGLSGYGSVVISSPAALVLMGPASGLFGGVISGSGSLVVGPTTGVTQTLTGDNSYSGGTWVYGAGTLVAANSLGSATGSGTVTVESGGTLQIGNSSNTGIVSGPIIDGGTVDFAGSGSESYAALLSGTGIVTTSGNGTYTLSGPNSYGGGTTISGGATLVAANGTNGSATGSGTVLINAGNTLEIGNGSTTGTVVGNIVNGGQVEFGSSGAESYNGILSGSGNILLVGGGTYTLGGANTYSGSLEVLDGTLADSAANVYSQFGGSVLVASGSTLDVNDNETISNLTDVSGSGGSVVIASGRTLTLAGPVGAQFSGVISGAGAVALTPTISFGETFAGPNTYSGGTTINGQATLVAENGSNGSATGSGSITIGTSGTLQIGNAATPGTVSATTVSVSTGGNLWIGNGTADGTLSASSVSVTGSGVVAFGSGSATASVTAPILDSGGTNFGTGVEFNSSSPQTYDGVISGTGAVYLTGSGSVTLGGANLYSGSTYLTAGLLEDSAPNAFSPNSLMLMGQGLLDVTMNESIPALADYGPQAGHGVVDLAAGKTLTLTGTGSYTYTGSMSGRGALSLANSLLTQILAGTNSFTGGTSIAAGSVLQIGSGGTSGSLAGNVADSGELQFDRSDITSFFGAISGTGSVWQNGGGTLTLMTANTYSGGTHVFNPAGTLVDGVAGAFSPNSLLTLSGTVDVNFNEAVLGLKSGNGGGLGSVVLGSGVLLKLTDTITAGFEGVISGSGAVEIAAAAGQQTFTGANTYSGTTTIDSGATLQLGSASNGGLNGTVSGPIVDNGTLVFSEGANDATITNAISGTGSVQINGGGDNLILPNANTYSGGTAVTSNGTLIVTNTSGSATGSGSVSASGSGISNAGIVAGNGIISGPLTLNSGGGVAPGLPSNNGISPAILNVGSTTINGGSIFGFTLEDVNGPAGTGWGLLDVNGSLTLNATSGSPLTLALFSVNSSGTNAPVSNFNPANSYSWEFVNATGGITGFNPNAFAFVTSVDPNLNFANATNGGAFSVTESGNELFLDFTPVPEPSTWAMLLAGLPAPAIAVVWRRRRRDGRAAA